MDIREIVLGPGMAEDEALRVGVQALIAAAARGGVEMKIAPAPGASPCLIVGDAERNPHAAALGARAAGSAPVEPPQAFALQPLGKRGLLLCGASPLAEAYGLLWLAEHIEATGSIPRRATERSPAFTRRFFYVRLPAADSDDPPFVDRERLAAAVEAAKNDMRRALAYGASDIIMGGSQVAMPWDHAVLGPRSEQYARRLVELADYAHSLHLRAFAMSDEFLYLEEQLRRAGASLSPDDPAFWRVLQDKYRGLLRRAPALDGVGTRIGEVIPQAPLRAFDIIHNDSLLSLEEKYRRFLKAMHDVVVGEFGKEYYHRTWVVNDWEQHSVPEILEPILADIPTDKMIVSIKLTKTDQWYYQALNPTIGVTPHETTVELELVHSYHGHQEIPDYPGEWIQAGLRYAHARGAVGITLSLPNSLWMEAPVATAVRVAWDPREDLTAIAGQWAARRFGAAAAPHLARMMLLSDDAFLKGLYVKPYASTHAWDPLPHTRISIFVVRGDSLWDEGRGHLAFLRDMYWQCAPYADDTVREIEQGIRIWKRVMGHYEAAQPLVAEAELAADTRRRLDHGLALFELNHAYVKGWFRYFEYEERPDARRRRAAAAALADIEAMIAAYKRAGGNFDLIGIQQFLDTAHRGLASADEAARLAVAPPPGFASRCINQRMGEEAALLSAAKDAVRILSWEANIDGRDLVTLTRDGRMEVKHVRADHMHGMQYSVHAAIPSGWRVVVKPIEVRMAAYVVEQPTADNDGRVVFCVDDWRPGSVVYRLELWAAPQ